MWGSCATALATNWNSQAPFTCVKDVVVVSVGNAELPFAEYKKYSVYTRRRWMGINQTKGWENARQKKNGQERNKQVEIIESLFFLKIYRTIESLRLEKTSKVIESSHWTVNHYWWSRQILLCHGYIMVGKLPQKVGSLDSQWNHNLSLCNSFE